MPAQTKNPARLPIRRESRSLIMKASLAPPGCSRPCRPGPDDIKIVRCGVSRARHFRGVRSLRTRFARREDLGLTPAEFAVLKRLSGPEKIQDFLHALTANFEIGGQTCLSVREVLRRRDPVYRTLRELAMSYLHEYANKGGQKTLRGYSRPFDLRRLAPELWVTNEKNCWNVGETIDAMHHYPLVTKKQARRLRRRDPMERKAEALLEHRRPRS